MFIDHPRLQAVPLISPGVFVKLGIGACLIIVWKFVYGRQEIGKNDLIVNAHFNIKLRGNCMIV